MMGMSKEWSNTKVMPNAPGPVLSQLGLALELSPLGAVQVYTTSHCRFYRE